MSLLPKRVFWSPQNLVLDVTNNCNLRCIMCLPQLLKQESKSMTFSEFLTATKDFSPRSVSIGATGEPLLNRNLGAMVKHLHERGTKIIITTNGTLVNKVADWIQLVDVLRVSIDACTEETYETIRRSDEFEGLVSNIREIVLLGRPLIRFEYIIMSVNYEEMAQFIGFCRDLNVEGAFFRLFQELQLPEESVERLSNVPKIQQEIMRALRSAEMLKVRTNLQDLSTKLTYIKQRYAREQITDDRRKHICLLPWLQLFVRVDGEAGPCCDLLEVSNVSVGNIFQDEHVWNSNKMKEVREIFVKKRNYDLYLSCQSCEFSGWKQLLKWTALMPRWFSK